MTSGRLGILQVSTFDSFGGAARVAWSLFRAYRERGHDSWLAVGEQREADPDVFEIPDDPGRLPVARTIARAVEYQLGVEDFHFPGTGRVLDLPPRRPTILHAHNLHGGYFDLRALEWLSHELPVVLTLHDAWLLSGHCAHSLECERWRIGCGQCPDLTLEPAARRDATAFNWRRKAAIYRRSRLHVATPSAWLMDRVEQSMLAPGIVDARVIANGVDTSVFRPGSRAAARAALGLPPDAHLVLTAANSVRTNMWKDHETARSAAELLGARLAVGSRPGRLALIGLGDDAPSEQSGQAELRFVAYESDPDTVALWYRAADVYLQPARADTFPNTVIEAMACGTPVVGTAVGGIPEQIDDGRTGLLVPPGNPMAMADALHRLLTEPELRDRMGRAAGDEVKRRFGLDQQVDAYLGWYAELAEARIAERRTRHAVLAPS